LNVELQGVELTLQLFKDQYFIKLKLKKHPNLPPKLYINLFQN